MISGGHIIRTARKARGYSQRELAEQYGMGVTTLQNWEQGRNEPPFKTVLEILQMLNYELQEVADCGID